MALECQQETQEPEGAIDLWRPASAQANGLPYGLGDEQRLTQGLPLSLVTPSSSRTPARCAWRPEQPTATLHGASVTPAPASLPRSASTSSRSSAKSTARTRVPRVARGSVSPLPERSSRCTAGAFGLNRRWVKGRRSAWAYPCAPQPQSVQYE